MALDLGRDGTEEDSAEEGRNGPDVVEGPKGEGHGTGLLGDSSGPFL